MMVIQANAGMIISKIAGYSMTEGMPSNYDFGICRGLKILKMELERRKIHLAEKLTKQN